jgi:hypothetical protein
MERGVAAKKKKTSRMPKLLFVDTNIWLDFYRNRSETALKLLRHLDDVADRLIATYQLEMEYKKNRHAAIIEGFKSLTIPPVPRLGILSDAKELQKIQTDLRAAEARAKKLRARLTKILREPTKNDEVFKVCQRVFHRDSNIVLTREMPERRRICSRALRRFLMGYPPRKNNDVTCGDAINWEWMLHCASAEKAELVIVTRDGDYGTDFDGEPLLNDFLKHEFRDRVSQKREVLLFRKLSEALKHFDVKVTPDEARQEEEMIASTVVAEADALSAGTTLIPKSITPSYQPAINSLMKSVGKDSIWANVEQLRATIDQLRIDGAAMRDLAAQSAHFRNTLAALNFGNLPKSAQSDYSGERDESSRQE